MHCNHERIIGIVLNSINQIGCKSTLGHLFFCSRKHNSKNICLLCTRMICFEKIVVTYLKNWMKYYSRKFYTIYLLIKKKKNAYEALNYCHISLNCSIQKSKINPYNDWYRKSNFSEVFYFGANHPLLVHYHIMTIAIRVFF